MSSTLLSRLDDRLLLTDGGLETDLLFNHGVDLPEFAAYPLLADPRGTERLRAYYEGYLALAAERGAGFVLESPTWRASPVWAARLGHDAGTLDGLNRAAIGLMTELRDAWAGRVAPILVSGCVGPHGDGYRPDEQLTADEAERYHAVQVGTFAGTAVDLVTAVTMTHVEEAIGVVRAARAAGLPAVVSFTVETDGRLPSGQPLGAAIEQLDDATGGAAAYVMLNCAHPTHFADVLEPGAAWTGRIRALRANASTCSHAELDEAAELDAGDPDDLAARYVALRTRLPRLSVLGGCCGTDLRHVAAIARAWPAQATAAG